MAELRVQRRRQADRRPHAGPPEQPQVADYDATSGRLKTMTDRTARDPARLQERRTASRRSSTRTTTARAWGTSSSVVWRRRRMRCTDVHAGLPGADQRPGPAARCFRVRRTERRPTDPRSRWRTVSTIGIGRYQTRERRSSALPRRDVRALQDDVDNAQRMTFRRDRAGTPITSGAAVPAGAGTHETNLPRTTCARPEGR